MYDIVTKAEYWRWLEEKINDPTPRGPGLLKHIQDTFILAALKDVNGCKILEFGGGESRVLKRLAKTNECWNADKFEGAAGGPTRFISRRGVKVVKTFIGEHDGRLPDGYFDYVISVSVLEHIPAPELDAIFADCARILKPGGQLVQAIDLYMPDAIDKDAPEHQYSRPRLPLYLKAAQNAGFELKEPAAIDGDACFRGWHASNSDATLYAWNSVAPKLRATRERAQSVALKAWWVKPV